MNIVTVIINDVEYNLRGEENEEYLHKVARYVDKKLKNTIQNNPKLSLSSAAVLTALNSADDMFKCDSAYEELKKEADKLGEAEKNLKQELESLKKQLKYMENYNTELQSKLNTFTGDEYLREKDAELEKLKKELSLTQENAKQYLNEKNKLSEQNKAIKFQLQTYKYKTMDLQQKLIENGIELSKAKKKNNALIISD